MAIRKVHNPALNFNQVIDNHPDFTPIDLPGVDAKFRKLLEREDETGVSPYQRALNNLPPTGMKRRGLFSNAPRFEVEVWLENEAYPIPSEYVVDLTEHGMRGKLFTLKAIRRTFTKPLFVLYKTALMEWGRPSEAANARLLDEIITNIRNNQDFLASAGPPAALSTETPEDVLGAFSVALISAYPWLDEETVDTIINASGLDALAIEAAGIHSAVMPVKLGATSLELPGTVAIALQSRGEMVDTLASFQLGRAEFSNTLLATLQLRGDVAAALQAMPQARRELVTALAGALHGSGDLATSLAGALQGRGELASVLAGALQGRGELSTTLAALLQARMEVANTLSAALLGRADAVGLVGAGLQSRADLAQALGGMLQGRGELGNALLQAFQGRSELAGVLNQALGGRGDLAQSIAQAITNPPAAGLDGKGEGILARVEGLAAGRALAHSMFEFIRDRFAQPSAPGARLEAANPVVGEALRNREGLSAVMENLRDVRVGDLFPATRTMDATRPGLAQQADQTLGQLLETRAGRENLAQFLTASAPALMAMRDPALLGQTMVTAMLNQAAPTILGDAVMQARQAQMSTPDMGQAVSLLRGASVAFNLAQPTTDPQAQPGGPQQSRTPTKG